METPTRYAAPPPGTRLLVVDLDQCCRVSNPGEDGSPVSQRGGWDHILQWHLSQPAAESMLVAGSVSEAGNPQSFKSTSVLSYYLQDDLEESPSPASPLIHMSQI